MSQPTREEVEAFIAALNYGMKVSHSPEFLIALAEGWLSANGNKKVEKPADSAAAQCRHSWAIMYDPVENEHTRFCENCGQKAKSR